MVHVLAKGYGRYPESSDRILRYQDVGYLSKSELKIMHNEIFARHGYIFKTQAMRQYFNKQSWYKPLYDDVNAMLSSTEKENVELIKK